MAFVISVLNTKGGVGKSTLSINLAEAYFRRDARILLIDYDFHQQTTIEWKDLADQAGKETCRVVAAENELPRLVNQIRDDFDVILIDAPGRLEGATTTLIAVADLVLIPVQPSVLDLNACRNVITWIGERRMITGGQPEARFVMSRCNADERVNQVDVDRVEATGIPTLTSRTVQRVAYPRVYAEGNTVFDLPADDKARCEIEEIYLEIERIRDVSFQSY